MAIEHFKAIEYLEPRTSSSNGVKFYGDFVVEVIKTTNHNYFYGKIVSGTCISHAYTGSYPRNRRTDNLSGSFDKNNCPSSGLKLYRPSFKTRSPKNLTSDSISVQSTNPQPQQPLLLKILSLME